MDLRWARSETQLHLNNARFRDAIADVALALRGVPKDDLESEEVTQHRRTIRTAWSAGVIVVLLAVAAFAASIFAVGQRNEAQDSAASAEENAATAKTNAELAEEQAMRADAAAVESAQNAALAERNEAEAEANAADSRRFASLARSRELAAASASEVGSDPELATLLAVLSARQIPEKEAISIETIRALRSADQANTLRLRIEVPGISDVAVTPDGRSVLAFSAAVGQDPVLSAFDLDTGIPLWPQVPFVDNPGDEIVQVLAKAVEGRPVKVQGRMGMSPDGSMVAISRPEWEGGPGSVWVLSVESGDVIQILEQACPLPLRFLPAVLRRFFRVGDWHR